MLGAVQRQGQGDGGEMKNMEFPGEAFQEPSEIIKGE